MDLMSLKVDFYRDKFNRIWLLQTDKLVVRTKRTVPSQGSHLLADVVIRKMKEVEEKELAEKKILETLETEMENEEIMQA